MPARPIQLQARKHVAVAPGGVEPARGWVGGWVVSGVFPGAGHAGHAGAACARTFKNGLYRD